MRLAPAVSPVRRAFSRIYLLRSGRFRGESWLMQRVRDPEYAALAPIFLFLHVAAVEVLVALPAHESSSRRHVAG